MKRIDIIISIFICVFLINHAVAKIWRVDNNPGNSGADFTRLADATISPHVISGDSIYVSGSSLDYTGIVNISKHLYIFGPGYFLPNNPNTQANLAPARIAERISFGAGSEGSIITGLFIGNVISINADNITIRRNRVEFSGISLLLTIHTDVSNLIIAQNYILNTRMSSGSGAIRLTNGNSNIMLLNNYIKSNFTTLETPLASDIQAINNIIEGEVLINGVGHFKNNILMNGNYTGPNIITSYNLGDADQFDISNNNQQNVNMNDVFLFAGSNDGQWQLKTGSPAIGAGEGGVDCGIYGGFEPYKLSGIPAIPAVYFFSAPTTGSGSQGLPIQIKIKSHF